jgi:ribosomal protein L11 methyltransferase
VTVEPRFPYLQIDAASARAEELAAAMFEVGATGVETRDDTTTPRGPGGDMVRLVASFDSRADAETAASEFAAAFADVACEVGELVGDAWRDAYKQFFAPFALTDTLVVVPPWVEDHRPAPSQRVLWMDPGRAFGTGLHATTRLVAEALEKHKGALAGRRVLDVGTGSGILALVALLLGASDAEAIDNDPEVIDVARENAERNGLSDRLHVSTMPLERIREAFPIVVANIRAGTLIEMRAALHDRIEPSGMLVLSGILASERDEVAQAFARAAFTIEETTARGEGEDSWVAITVRPS